MTTMMMSEVIGPAHMASKGVTNPMLDLFRVPMTDVSLRSYEMVPVQTYTTGINPIEFEINPQEGYIDLSRSYFRIELYVKKNDTNNMAVEIAISWQRLWIKWTLPT